MYLSALILTAPAWANLGSDETSVTADRDAFRGQLRSTPLQQYTVHEITDSSGTVVREYATPAGKVFAVTWQGPMPPDLRQLFGNYFERYKSAIAARPRPGSHRQLSITQSDLVVQASGHLRAFQGVAYLPPLVPPGVSIANLR
jgi:hypothetical protein